LADGSAAQVGVAGDELVVAEKSNTVETVALNGGAVSGSPRAVALPSDSNTPFGLVTRDANAYVTIAHSDEISLIKNDTVIAIAATGTVGGSGQHSPCWLALLGPYLYSSNSAVGPRAREAPLSGHSRTAERTDPMSAIAYTSRIRLERRKGPLRIAYLPGEAQPVTFSVHGAIAEHYKVDPTSLTESHASTIDYVIAATAG